MFYDTYTFMAVLQTQAPLAQLRQMLDATERSMVTMYESQGGAAETLRAVDGIYALLEQIEASGSEARGERVRAEDLLRRLARGAGRLVRHVRATGGAQALASSDTWRLLEQVADDDARARARRLWWGVGIAVGVVLLLAGLVWAFPGQPVANTNGIIARLQDGDYAAALELARAEQKRVPTDPQGALWVGALQLRAGNKAEAEAAFAAARKLLPDDRAFYGTRGPMLLELGLIDDAEADARALLAIPAAAPNGHFLQGQVYAARGLAPEAIHELQAASDLAEKAGDATLAVTAKMAMQSVMQSPPLAITPSPAP